MALTVTNMNTLRLLSVLNKTTAAQTNTLTRLATGWRINSGKDDPAGLIAMRSLMSELAAVDASIINNQRTDSMLGVAEASLNEVAGLLQEIETLAIASANTDGISAAEVAANQEQVDQALAAIDRIIGSASFNGKKLLDGSLGINVTGVTAANITDVRVSTKNPNNTTAMAIDVTAAASQAVFTLATVVTTTDSTITIQGKDGTVVIDIASSAALSAVAAQINNATAQTGVTASASGANLSLLSSDYGTDAFVRVQGVTGDTTNLNAGDDYGADATVIINGQSAVVDGLQVNYNGGGVSATFNLSTAYNTAGGTDSFTISGGGATFQLGTNSTTRATIGLDGLYTQQLGSSVTGLLSSLRGGGTNNLSNDPNQAAQIAREATTQVARFQGQLGGFRRFQVETAMNQQVATRESLTSALSIIRDTDFAKETAELNKQNILVQSAISLLGLANQQAAQILLLL